MGMLLAFVFAKQSTSTLHISKAKQITECSDLKIAFYELKNRLLSFWTYFYIFVSIQGKVKLIKPLVGMSETAMYESLLIYINKYRTFLVKFEIFLSHYHTSYITNTNYSISIFTIDI